MRTVELTVPVGPPPDTGDPVEISHDAFDAGCYVGGLEAQPRTAPIRCTRPPTDSDVTQ